MVTVRFARRIGWGHILAACAVDWDSFVYRPLLNSLWSATGSFRTLWHAIGLLLSLPGVAFVSFRDALERSFACLANFWAPLRSLGDTQSIFFIDFPGEITDLELIPRCRRFTFVLPRKTIAQAMGMVKSLSLDTAHILFQSMITDFESSEASCCSRVQFEKLIKQKVLRLLQGHGYG